MYLAASAHVEKVWIKLFSLSNCPTILNFLLFILYIDFILFSNWLIFSKFSIRLFSLFPSIWLIVNNSSVELKEE